MNASRSRCWILLLAGVALVSPALAQRTAEQLAAARESLGEQHARNLVDLAATMDKQAAGMAASHALEKARILSASVASACVLESEGARDWRTREQSYVQIVFALEEGISVDPKSLAAVRRVYPLLADVAVEQHRASQALAKLADEYRKIGELDSAMSVAGEAVALHVGAAQESYNAAAEAQAKQHYSDVARPYMEELRKKHVKVGRSKGWKIKGMTIQSARPDLQDAALVSEREIAGDLTLSGELYLPAQMDAMVFVVAWKDSKNFCGVEIARRRNPEVHLIHVERGQRKVLAKAASKSVRVGVFFPIHVAVEDGKLTTNMGLAPCQVPMPMDNSKGMRFGLLRPALRTRGKITKAEAKRVLQVRNLMAR